MQPRGVRTSEFWLTVLAAVALGIGGALGFDFDVLAWLVAAYLGSRGLAKLQRMPPQIPLPPPPPPPPDLAEAEAEAEAE